jgi:hypothetical protein
MGMATKMLYQCFMADSLVKGLRLLSEKREKIEFFMMWIPPGAWPFG